MLLNEMRQFESLLIANSLTYDVQRNRFESLYSAMESDNDQLITWLNTIKTDIHLIEPSTLKVVNDLIDPAIQNNNEEFANLRKDASRYYNHESESYQKIGTALLVIGIILVLAAVAVISLLMTGGLSGFLMAGWMTPGVLVGAGVIGGGSIVLTVLGSMGLFKSKQPAIYQTLQGMADEERYAPLDRIVL